MPLCGSRNCESAIISSGTITVTGSGNQGDPYVLSGSAEADPTVVVHEESTVWSKPAGLRYIDVEVQAPGGGSGGCATTGASQGAFGTGGGGGGYGRKLILATALATNETVTVGDPGTGGAAGANPGTGGGVTSFGSHLSATGGAGGTGGAASAAFSHGTGGAGGTATGGDVNIPGARGWHGVWNVSVPTNCARPSGGVSFLGPGVSPGGSTGTGFAGNPGNKYGAGAAGACNGQSQATARAGAVGGGGAVIIREYF